MTVIDFTPTRQAGLERLADFAPKTGDHYRAQRNFDFGPERRDNVSALSPWVRSRLLEESELVEAALERFDARAVDKWVQEVCWRTYWKGWLEHRPGVWDSYADGLAAALSDVDKNGGIRRDYEAAIEGRTGIEGFDDWARELVEHGYIANHSRMWFASIWIFTLKLPWELGADFFLRHLMDGDAASNTLSWRWVAGLHTKGKTYLARRSNISKYTDGRFSPDGLASSAVPLDGATNPGLSGLRSADEWPGAKVALLLCEEDLRAETLLPRGAEITALAGACWPEARSPLEVGDVAGDFVRGALGDGLQRAEDAFGVTAAPIPRGDDAVDALTDWARASRANTVVTALPPIGWVKPELDELRRRLAKANIDLLYLQRDWDAAFWPHAKKGFFGLKKQIPGTLRELGFGI